MIYGNIVGTNNGGIGKSFVIKDENGNEAVAVMVEEETEFTATANDIREGVVAATDSGVTEGTKYIPSYNTSEGIQIIPANQSLYIRIKDYEYTKLQAVVCPFNSSMTNSVSTEKVVIEDNVYEPHSTTIIAKVAINNDDGTIVLGIINDFGKPCLIRYFSYKEIY